MRHWVTIHWVIMLDILPVTLPLLQDSLALALLLAIVNVLCHGLIRC